MSWKPDGKYQSDQYGKDMPSGADCPELEQKLKMLYGKES